MIVDSSAVLAIFFEEPEVAQFAARLAASGAKRISAANYLECAIVLGNAAEGASLEFDAFLEEAGIAVAVVIRDPVERFGTDPTARLVDN